MKKTHIVITILVLLVLGFLFIGKGKKVEVPTVNIGNQKSESVKVVQNESTGIVKEFTVTGKNFSLMPSLITVKKGDTVKVTFKNENGFHDFKIDEFNVVARRINSGAEESVEFVANKIGSFEYYCSVGSHRAMGMSGTLKVE